MEMINHFSHEKHPLILKELQDDDDDEDVSEVVCYGCEQPVSAGSMMYCCNECEVFLHKSCAELSPEISHSTHTQHALKLLRETPYWFGFSCDICGGYSRGFLYHCSECMFDLDVVCAQLHVEGIYKPHIHEEHPLILKEFLQEEEEEEEEVVRDDEKVGYNCYVCQEPVLSGSLTYFCIRCEIYFHKSCVELPPEVKHPMHFEHPLKLFSKSPYEVGSCICNVCKRSWSGLTYHCSTCEFDVDVLCARLNNIIKHPSHHHLLKVQTRSASFECDACGLEKRDESYDCTECSFWIHKACASLPTTSPFKDHPHGHLSLAYCVPQKYRSYGFKCDVCRTKLHPSEWLYYCGPCRYFVHLNCMSKEDDPADEVPPNVIRLPVEGVSSALIHHFFSEHNNNGLQQIEESPTTEIDHFSHHHPLVLSKVEDDYSEMCEDDQETVCDGCAEPILGSCYSCAQCKYFIHLHCAQLPTEISHLDHAEHNLSLSQCMEFFRFSYCKICGRECNGFFYECKVCDFKVDIKCALLPATVKHEAHKHLLIRDKPSSNKLCNACKRNHGDVILGCNRCEFYLAIQCIMLPQIVRHRWDDHPLFLSAPPFYYHEDEFICDMCEEEIHPKFWLYHCRQCDNSFHPRCIPRLRKLPYVKFGGKLRIDYHPHPLTFARNAQYMSDCDRCGDDLSGMTVFECESCMLSLCRLCVCQIVPEVFNLEELFRE